MKQAFAEHLAFFRQFRETFETTGAVAPSSRFLAKALTEPLSQRKGPVRVLEVGPGTAFTAEVLENAPSFNRDVRDVIRIDPRVSLDRDDGGSGQDRISCLGGNDRGNSFTVDGLAQSDIYGLNDTGFSSRSSTPVPYDAVRETQVQFAPMDTEYGNFTGCAINVVTRGGTNKFHGTAWYEYSNNDLRGDKVDGNPVGKIQPDKRFGFSFGGPILIFEPARELTFSNNWESDGWPVPTLITLRLTPLFDACHVELFHHGFERLGTDASAELQGYESGWHSRHLEALKAIVEG